MSKKLLFAFLGVLVVVGVVLLITQKKEAVSLNPTAKPTAVPTYDPNGPLAFTSDEIGIGFMYPRAWGVARAAALDASQNGKGKAMLIVFDGNPNVHITALSSDYQENVAYKGNLQLEKLCPKPINVEERMFGPTSGLGYCRLYTDNGQYLFETVSISGANEGDKAPHLIQRAIFNINNASGYNGLEFYQKFPDVNLTAISSTYSKTPTAQAGFTTYLQSIINKTASTSLNAKIADFETTILSLKVK